MALDPEVKALIELREFDLHDKCYLPVLIHEKRVPSDIAPESILWTSDQSKVTCKECLSWIHA